MRLEHNPDNYKYVHVSKFFFFFFSPRECIVKADIHLDICLLSLEVKVEKATEEE